MKEIIGFERFYDAQELIRFWNKELINKGAIKVVDLEGFICYPISYDNDMEWTNLLTTDNFKRDKHGIYILMLPDPDRPRF